MARYIALLRGINVGGNKKVPMASLRAMTEQLGFAGVETVLQSGNLIFTGKAQSVDRLEKKLEAATLETLEVDCEYVIRDAAEWRRAIEANPFGRLAARDPSHLLVVFCRGEPDRTALEAMRATARGSEDFTLIGRELYVAYPDGIGQSKLAAAFSRSRLGTVTTGRNWNTVLRIADLL